MSRLTDLLAMRRFIEAEIRDEMSRLRREREAEAAAAEMERVAEDVAAAQNVLISVAFAYGTSVEKIRSDSRRANVTAARQAAAWLLRQRGMSLTDIGRALNRDHTTVLYAVRKLDATPALRVLAEAVEVAA